LLSFCFLTADPKSVADARPWPTDVATLFWAFMGGALRGSPKRLGVSGGSRGMVAKFGNLHGGPQSSTRILAGDKTRMRVFFDRVEPRMKHAMSAPGSSPLSPLSQLQALSRPRAPPCSSSPSSRRASSRVLPSPTGPALSAPPPLTVTDQPNTELHDENTSNKKAQSILCQWICLAAAMTWCRRTQFQPNMNRFRLHWREMVEQASWRIWNM
jgi:hypothetical protein